MDVSKLFTKICQLFEQFIVHCKWYAGEIHPEVLGKAFTVLIAVQDSIDVVEYLLRLELRPLIAELIQKLRIDIESPLCGGKDVFFVLVWVEVKGEDIGYLACPIRNDAVIDNRIANKSM